MRKNGQAKAGPSNAFLRSPSARMRLLRLLNSRRTSGLSEAPDSTGNARLDEWENRSIREATAQDPSKLAESLTPDRHKVIREHLDINGAELWGLVGRKPDARRRKKLR